MIFGGNNVDADTDILDLMDKVALVTGGMYGSSCDPLNTQESAGYRLYAPHSIPETLRSKKYLRFHVKTF